VSALEALTDARRAGITLRADGADLVWEADTAPPTSVLDQLRQHKVDLLRLLAAPEPATWSRGDWLAFYDERAGIVEHDGGLPHAEAERRAYECCIVEWLSRHPAKVVGSLAECASCGLPPTTRCIVIPYGSNDHVWLHPLCWPAWSARRLAAARTALAAFGIVSALD